MTGITCYLRLAVLASVIGLTNCTRDAGTPGGSASTGTPWFKEDANARGLAFRHESGARGELLFPEISCGGGALFDMDDDGDLDAYLVQAGPFGSETSARPPNELFRNDGAGTFTNVTTGSGADDRGYGMGVATGDFDGDGDLDVYVTNVGNNTLLRNDGGGRFTDVTAASGTGDQDWGTSAAFLDYDSDGDLDLFVVNYIHWSVATERICHAATGERDYCAPNTYEAPATDVLFRNEGDGTFTDVTRTAGINAAFGNGLGVVCGDFDGDGRIDVFVANDGTRNQLWINAGDGTFRDAALEMGTALDEDGTAKAGMGVCAADTDDDGDLDLLVVNLIEESDSFYRNEGNYFFDDTAAVGLGTVSRLHTRFGMALLDFDNDGHLDLFEANGRVRRQSHHYADDPFAEPNVLFRGGANGRFTEVRPRGGTSVPLIATSRAAVFGDVDGDGRLDVLVVNRDGPAHLLINTTPPARWLMLDVRNTAGAPALGATVTLKLGDRTLTRDVRTAYSYCAANESRVHVGLGNRSKVDDIVVRWPDGTTESFGSRDADQVHRLDRGRSTR